MLHGVCERTAIVVECPPQSLSPCDSVEPGRFLDSQRPPISFVAEGLLEYIRLTSTFLRRSTASLGKSTQAPPHRYFVLALGSKPFSLCTWDEANALKKVSDLFTEIQTGNWLRDKGAGQVIQTLV
mgnify:CR=1 FL=1